VAPLEASSGKHRCHRLDRGGDRQLNRALHTVVLQAILPQIQQRRFVARPRLDHTRAMNP
jgi:transposase